MARCEEGYLCQVCGRDVEHLYESELYLRFVIGELDPELLHTTPEKHIRCVPVLAQFIEHPNFESIRVEGPFGCQELDAEYVAVRRDLVSRGYVRLREIDASQGDRDVTAYPLSDAIALYRQKK